MRRMKGDYGRQPPAINIAQATARHGKPDPDGVERPQPAPVKTGRAIRPEDIPGYQGHKPPQE